MAVKFDSINKAHEGMKLYWSEKNTKTLNGLDTKVMEFSK